MSSEVMTAKDLRDRTNEELVSFVQEKSEELFKLRFQHYTGQLENTARLKTVRRELARARTVVTERDLGVEIKTRPMDLAAPAGATDDAESNESTEEEDES